MAAIDPAALSAILSALGVDLSTIAAPAVPERKRANAGLVAADRPASAGIKREAPCAMDHGTVTVHGVERSGPCDRMFVLRSDGTSVGAADHKTALYAPAE